MLGLQYFNNEKYEAREYDKLLAKYETASLKTATSLAALNFGQNAIMSASLAGLMLMCAQNIQNGERIETVH
jgi:ATP-binding cassette subfamily B (MDR/TAP) protein 7